MILYLEEALGDHLIFAIFDLVIHHAYVWFLQAGGMRYQIDGLDSLTVTFGIIH